MECHVLGLIFNSSSPAFDIFFKWADVTLSVMHGGRVRAEVVVYVRPQYLSTDYGEIYVM